MTPVLRATHVARPPEEAFALFAEQIGAWWPLHTHGVYGAASGGVGFADGRLVERSVDGQTSVWGEVLAWEPPRRLCFTWHPGRDGDPSSRVEISFVEDAGGTRVELVHDGWEAFGADAAARRRGYVGPAAWGLVLDHFAHLVEGARICADLDALAEAYQAFFAEAALGGFGPPEPGEWTAERVIAHVAVNDDAMAAVCRALIHGHSPLAFDNVACHDLAALDGLVAACDGRLDHLVDAGRARSADLRLLLMRLDDDQRAASVHAHLRDHGTTVLDDARPWWGLAVRTQTGFHLPLHTAQLRSLRP